MPQVAFTPNLRRHLAVEECRVAGATVRAVLETVFEQNPRLRDYLLDDQNRLRRHVNVFVDGKAVADRIALSDPVTEEGRVVVMQALSGG
jgi:hypothetical protein